MNGFGDLLCPMESHKVSVLEGESSLQVQDSTNDDEKLNFSEFLAYYAFRITVISW